MSSPKTCPRCGATYELDQRFCPKDGLARDVDSRYRSANEFGQALADALEYMPSAASKPIGAARGAAAEQPTLPVTRVSPDRRPLVPAPPATPRQAGMPARRNRVAYSFGGAVFAAALIGAAVVMRRPDPTVANQDSVTPSGPSTSDVRKPDSSGSAQQPGAVQLAGKVGTGSSGQRSVVTPRPAEVTAVLDSLEKVVSGDVTPEAANVISALEQMKDRISGNEQHVQAAVVDALAESSRNNKAAACRALRNVDRIAPTTTLAKRVSFAVSQSC